MGIKMLRRHANGKHWQLNQDEFTNTLVRKNPMVMCTSLLHIIHLAEPQMHGRGRMLTWRVHSLCLQAWPLRELTQTLFDVTDWPLDNKESLWKVGATLYSLMRRKDERKEKTYLMQLTVKVLQRACKV